MQTSEVTTLINSLQSGVVFVTFKKINTGEIRRMESTLNPEILKENGIVGTVESISAESDNIAVYPKILFP